ncbi:MAG: hypothetical protein AMJ78_06415 [Omnitrophica WOR_2 bacterium SM23_29]|nr:MAG: hypothetical protein AMJ78_06415 [Omnitrophica WOR_2 bacterium SM23_29]
MKRIKFLAFFIILTLVAGLFILNIEVTTRQGINYKVHTLKMPLYLKILDFYDRHYNYKLLAHRITKGRTTEDEKVMAIFRWTIENISKQPRELKTVDDHVWHIIVRGYGTLDQFSDAFTTLCNYAGIDALFLRLLNKDGTSKFTFSFVRINKRWRVFDPYNGTYFVTEGGSLASIEEIANGNWIEKNIPDFKKPNRKYSDYFDGISTIDFEEAHKTARANIQSPINRLIYGIKHKQNKKKPDFEDHNWTDE